MCKRRRTQRLYSLELAVKKAFFFCLRLKKGLKQKMRSMIGNMFVVVNVVFHRESNFGSQSDNNTMLLFGLINSENNRYRANSIIVYVKNANNVKNL